MHSCLVTHFAHAPSLVTVPAMKFVLELQQLDVFGKGSASCVLITDAEAESVSEPRSQVWID